MPQPIIMYLESREFDCLCADHHVREFPCYVFAVKTQLSSVTGSIRLT